MTLDPRAELQAVFEALSDTPQTLDDLAAATGLDLGQVTASLAWILAHDGAEGALSPVAGGRVTYKRKAQQEA